MRHGLFVVCIFGFGFLLGALVTYTFVASTHSVDSPQQVPHQNAFKPDIHVFEPLEQSEVNTPLRIRGEAHGPWYFEGSFPVMLTNWNGLIIAEGFAQAQADWMTTDLVPFESILEFESPYTADSPDFMRRGTLILQRDNPSGLPEFDAAHEMTVWFSGE